MSSLSLAEGNEQVANADETESDTMLTPQNRSNAPESGRTMNVQIVGKLGSSALVLLPTAKSWTVRT